MRIALIAVLGLSLAACTTAQVTTAHQAAEKADVEAINLYAAVGLAVNAWETAKPADATKAEQVRSKAWSDLVVVNTAYKAGAAVDLSALTADLSAAKAQ